MKQTALLLVLVVFFFIGSGCSAIGLTDENKPILTHITGKDDGQTHNMKEGLYRSCLPKEVLTHLNKELLESDREVSEKGEDKITVGFWASPSFIIPPLNFIYFGYVWVDALYKDGKLAGWEFGSKNLSLMGLLAQELETCQFTPEGEPILDESRDMTMGFFSLFVQERRGDETKIGFIIPCPPFIPISSSTSTSTK
ncbi:MAG TPA: hypothetical protein ENF20_09140 [Candidatus Marinimicrobia bacterium]|nr:hypothetical protein [Candidatus Neomarinimicrobiota bacterium]